MKTLDKYTPPLKGKDAKRFFENMAKAKTEKIAEEILMRMRKSYEYMKSIGHYILYGTKTILVFVLTKQCHHDLNSNYLYLYKSAVQVTIKRTSRIQIP